MSGHFKINTWKDYGTAQIQAGSQQVYLDREDFMKLLCWVDVHRDEYDIS